MFPIENITNHQERIEMNLSSKLDISERLSSIKLTISLEDLPNELICHIMSMLSNFDLVKLAICSTKLFDLTISQSRKFLLKIPEDEDLYAKVRRIGLHKGFLIRANQVVGMETATMLFNNCDKYANDIRIKGKVEFMVALDHKSMRGFRMGHIELVRFVNDNLV